MTEEKRIQQFFREKAYLHTLAAAGRVLPVWKGRATRKEGGR